MKALLSVAILPIAMLFTIPAHASGWHFSAQPYANTFHTQTNVSGGVWAHSSNGIATAGGSYTLFGGNAATHGHGASIAKGHNATADVGFEASASHTGVSSGYHGGYFAPTFNTHHHRPVTTHSFGAYRFGGFGW